MSTTVNKSNLMRGHATIDSYDNLFEFKTKRTPGTKSNIKRGISKKPSVPKVKIITYAWPILRNATTQTPVSPDKQTLSQDKYLSE